MMTDIKTVMWKEWLDIRRRRGSRMKTFLTVVVPFAMFALWLPWEAGVAWLNGVPSMLACFALPLMIAMVTIPDSFAGERERNTLPTLLASRLPDSAILYGKAAFTIILAWAATVIVLVAALVTYNLVHWDGQLAFYSSRVLIGDLSLSLIVAALSVGAGVLISLRSATVQEAAQTLAAALLVPPALLGPVIAIVSTAKPEWGPKQLLAGADPNLVLLVFNGTLAFVALVLLGLAKARFQRSKLILR
jgi:ABC-2 type transport system permease protein